MGDFDAEDSDMMNDDDVDDEIGDEYFDDEFDDGGEEDEGGLMN